MSAILTDRNTSLPSKEAEVVIAVEQLSKKFCRELKRSLFYGVRDLATELVGGRRKSDVLRRGEFWALEDVSFQLRQGEALGLVGVNGAGKTTLLRIMSGLIKPDAGSVTVRGRVAPLIALGAGFNPVLTGRENIVTNMAILGLSTQEIKERFKEVVEFAGISEALDAPVQTYSSGMVARLAFACAVHIEPDILLIDEVLSVGDSRFRLKCFQKLAQLRAKGTAFILVSHDPQAVLRMCESTVYLSKGRIVASGETEKVMTKYEEDLSLKGIVNSLSSSLLARKPPRENSDLDIVSLSFNNKKGNVVDHLMSGAPVLLCIECIAYKEIDNVNVSVHITEILERKYSTLFMSPLDDNVYIKALQGKFEIQMYMPYCGLRPGAYNARVVMREKIEIFDYIDSFRFIVKSDKAITDRSLFYQPREWKILNRVE